MEAKMEKAFKRIVDECKVLGERWHKERLDAVDRMVRDLDEEQQAHFKPLFEMIYEKGWMDALNYIAELQVETDNA